jgi:hypothetical protein
LAFAIQGTMLRVVRDGKPVEALAFARTLESLIADMRGKAGRPHDVDDNFDAAVLLLLRAFALVTGATGRELLAVGLSATPGEPGTNTHDDAGPAAAFVRSAIAALAPDVFQLLGRQAVNAAVRRLRQLDIQEIRSTPPGGQLTK